MEYNHLNEMQVEGRQAQIRQDAKHARTVGQLGEGSTFRERLTRYRVAAILFVVTLMLLITLALTQGSEAQAQVDFPASGPGGPHLVY